VYTKEGWALLLPDPIEPIFHVYAEGATERQTENLAARYAALIRKFRT
jgi:phosphomannomutase